MEPGDPCHFFQMINKFFYRILLFVLTINNSVAQTKLFSIRNDLETATDNNTWINSSTIVKGNAFSGNFYSATDSIRQFGFGYKSSFPFQCRYKNLHIIFSEYVRANSIQKNFEMVVSVSIGDSILFWTSKNISKRILKIQTWVKIQDEIDLPSSITGVGYTLSVYLWNKEEGSLVDIDDIKIDFEEKAMPGFLPSGFRANVNNNNWQSLITNPIYSFLYEKEAGQLLILNSSGDTIISSLAIVSEWKTNGRKVKKQSWNYHFDFKEDSITDEGNYLTFSAKDYFADNEIKIFAGYKNELSFTVNSFFLRPVSLYRHSLQLGFKLPLKEIYNKNTLIDSVNFNNEYWVDKEGFKLSNGKRSVVLYHPETVSSLQLDVNRKFIIVNLDFAPDHPFLHFPLLGKNKNKFEDRSASIYNAGDSISSSFTFYSVEPDFINARMLTNPFGYLSSFIWTEHADYSDLRIQKAVYLGSEKVNQLNDATGGFLKYSIPVTKSIFYSNPDKVNNSDKAGFFPGLSASYKETPGFRDFLRLLDESGIEICLHTPDQYTSDRKLLSEALDATKKDFSSTTWIDHGYDNSIISNREDLVCDGFNNKSKWYAADLWKKYGIKYFWNSYFEDSKIFKDYSFNSFFSVPYSGWSEAMPTPLYWRNKTQTGDIIHWRTTDTMDPADGGLWSYYFSDLRLNDLVSNRNNIIIHCYPARADSSTGFYKINNGIIEVNEEFNKALSKLSFYRMNEKIRLTTIREMLDYRTSLEDVTFKILPNGNINLYNSGKATIRGISFSTIAKEVTAGAKEINKKNTGNELVFWMDLLPGENVILKLN